MAFRHFFYAIEDSPKDMFGKTMKLNDKLMLNYYKLLTNKTLEQVTKMEKQIQQKKAHPMQLKIELANFFVTKFYGAKEAKKAEEEFQNVFSKQKAPQEVTLHTIAPQNKVWICRLMQEAGLAPSTSEARRLIEGQAVELNNKKVTNKMLKLNLKAGEELLLKAGKRRFIKIKVNP